jgi:small nuclear ribonucleoprotein (snRNP)-like protein
MSNNLTFQIQKGGLARTADSLDHISALVFSTNPPPSWGTARAKKYFSLTQVETDGFTAVSALYAEFWYHASEFFRMNPQGALWLLMNPASVSQTLIQQCQGEVRQIGAYVTDVAQIGSVWQTLADTLDAAFCPAQIVVGWNGATPVLPNDAAFNMQLKSSPNVSLLAAGDGSGKGLSIALALGKVYLPAFGTVVGLMSRALVSENIGWVEKFNASNGQELETAKLSDGTVAPTDDDVDPYDNAKIIVFRKLLNYGGTYINDTYTAIVATDDFATIENNRTMQKCKRLIRAALIPHFNRPVKVDPESGKLNAGLVSFLEGEIERPLINLQNREEISGQFVSIDPNQNVLSNSIVVIDVGITPFGVARQLVVKIGYRVKLSGNF